MSNKRARNVSSGYSCVTCQKDVEDEGIECQWCYRWEHRRCAELTEAEYTVLSNSSSKIMFFCTMCYTKIPFALRVDQESASHQSILDQRLQSIEEKLNKLENSCSVSNNVVSGPEEVTHHMESQDQTNANKRVDSTSEVLTSFINEEKERCKRRLNLIVHNVLESSADNGSERKSHDINTVTSIFEKYLGVKVKITNANRIGRKKEGQLRPRLTKVSVESEREKAVILRNCTKLRARDIPEEIQNVYITPDLTPREQQHNKALRAQLAEMNKDGKKYWIKNGRIVQRGD